MSFSYIEEFENHTIGGLDLTGKAAVLKTAGLYGPWGFESLVLRCNKVAVVGLQTPTV
jgi:hypothetical protein